ISYQAGGYSAEFGGRNAGLISTTTRTGGDRFRADFEVNTDAWGDPEEEYLGTHPYGNTQFTVTAGGPATPLTDKLRFFCALQWNDNNNPVNRSQPITLTSMYAERLRQTRAWDILPDEQKYMTDANGNQVIREGIFDPQQGQRAQIVDVSYPGGVL